MTPVDAARVLGVRAGAGPEEIRGAFRAAVRAVHPDTGGDEGRAGEAVARLIAARDELLRASGNPVPGGAHPGGRIWEDLVAGLARTGGRWYGRWRRRLG